MQHSKYSKALLAQLEKLRGHPNTLNVWNQSKG